MNGTTATRRRTSLVVAVGVAATLAACSSSSSTSPSPAASGASSSTSAGSSPAGSSPGAGASAGSSGVTAAEITSLRNGTPGTTTIPAIPNLSSLKGKTLVYVPILQAVPTFQPAIAALKDVAALTGVKLTICDGGGNPTATASCLSQAVRNKPAAVITDAIDAQFAAQGFKALQAAGIPRVDADEVQDTSTKLVASVGGQAQQFGIEQAKWVTYDSGGKADVLLLRVTDSTATRFSFANGVQKELAAVCPACTTTTVDVNTFQQQQIPSLVSSALIKDPKIQYIVSQFDNDIPPTIQALQTQNKTTIKVVGATSALQQLQALKSGQIVADAGYSSYEEGWELADQAFRLALGLPAINDYAPSTRVFDKTNIGALDLSSTGANNGSWFGATTFKARYMKAWGLQ